MSEKRFEITEYGSDYYIEIIDHEKELDESIYNPSQKLGLVECADLLNEQQSTIKHLEEYCGDLEADVKRLMKENEQLRTQLLQQSNDDGRFKVWQVPPIQKGTRISFTTNNDGDGV